MSYDGWCCQDCLFWLANGDLPEDETEAAEFLARIGDTADDGTVTLGRRFGEMGCEHTAEDWAADSEPHTLECETLDFSWAVCDVCGSALGGSRHAVTFN